MSADAAAALGRRARLKVTAVPSGAEVPSSDGVFTRLRRRFLRGNASTRTQRFIVMALDRRDGRVVWERVAREELPHEGTHETGTWASPSAVVDGEVAGTDLAAAHRDLAARSRRLWDL